MELWKGWSWDGSAYYVDPLTNQGFSGTVRIPAYTRLDTGLTWKALERLTLSIAGQNLVKKDHVEFEDFFGSMQSDEIKRSAYIKLTWRF
jgi:outer membrane receptor for ferrienterochelin and colicin